MVIWNHIGGVMVSVLVSSVVDRGLEPRSDQTKDYNIGFCCFSACRQHEGDRAKAQNQDNVSGWGDMYIRGLFCQ